MDAGLQAKILEEDLTRARGSKAITIIGMAMVGGRPYDQLFQQGRYQEAMYAVNEDIADVRQMLEASPQSMESAAFAYALLYRARSIIREKAALDPAVDPFVFFMESLIDFDTILQISTVPQLVTEIRDIQRVTIEEFLRLIRREIPNSEQIERELLANPNKMARGMYAKLKAENPDMYLPVDPYYMVSSKPIPAASHDDKPTYQASSNPTPATSADDKPAKKGCLAGLFGMFN